MSSLQSLKEFGETLGLTGKDLATFIKEQQAVEREERQKKRDYDLAQQQREFEQEKREKEHAHELERVRLQLEAARAAPTNRGRIGEHRESGDNTDDEEDRNRHRIRGPKMPPFDESRDNMDSFIHRFEVYASAHGCRETD